MSTTLYLIAKRIRDMIEKWIELVAAKLRCEGITQENYMLNGALAVIKDCLAAKRMSKTLIDNEKEIIMRLNGVEQDKLF